MQVEVVGGSKTVHKVPVGKQADIYREVNKYVPKKTVNAVGTASTSSKTTSAKSSTTKSASSGGGGSSGYGGSGIQTVQSPQRSSGGASYQASMKALDGLWAEASGYKGQLDTMLKTGFKYNPESDPQYKALQELAAKQAKVASKGAMETMNDRGILNSTVTSDRLGQIEQTAQDEVTKAVPQLEAQAYSKYMNQVQQLYNMWNATYDKAVNERAFTEDKRRWDSNFSEDSRRWNANYNMDVQKFNFSKEQAAIENALAARGMSLQEASHALNKMKADQDSIGIMNAQATQGALAELMAYDNMAEAFAHLSTNAERYKNAKASFSEIIATMEKRWPGFESAASGQVNFSSGQ